MASEHDVVDLPNSLQFGNSSPHDFSNTLTTTQMNAVAIVSLFTSGLSFIGAGSVLLCSVCHRRACYPEVFPTFHLSVADIFSALFLLVSSVIFLTDKPSFPGGSGPCGYIMTVVTSFYTTAFFLTITYALEALLRFRRRLTDSGRVDTMSSQIVSSKWMYGVYVACWVVPLCLAILLMVVIKRTDTGRFGGKLPKQCSPCFPDFRFNVEDCWEGVEDSGMWHLMMRLIFLIPLAMVMVVNMVLYFLVAKVYKQVAMRRGLLSYHQRQEESLLKRKAVMYQGVFFFCWTPSLVLGFASFADDFQMTTFFWLLLIQAIVAPLQGILNSILYGWKRDSFRRALSERTSLLSTNRSPTMSVTL